ncbi:hypothetical protein GCM10025865_20180 [Paraoerskovia sediminicola]|uniref:UDP-glucose 6-dehydrogenase n=1 Tax=Paraoerskovia sediminicola TaxID=1138587 RepID=A0ABM8G3J5_9CELL|nr:hypothetical protein GCM10025865_20180 [Paraoerskovia sediminicola]
MPVGTAARLRDDVRATGADLVWNPEFLREGHAVQDTISPDRIVYGVAADDPPSSPSPDPSSSASPAGDAAGCGAAARSVAVLDEVYAAAIAAGTPRLVTDLATAELVKTAANAFLATKISFINAMAEIAEVAGADVTQLADAIGHDARIGRAFLNAGVGFGGGCLPKDIRAVTARAKELGRGESLRFLEEVDAINLRRRERVVGLVVDALDGSVFGKKVAVLGVTFKPESDDVRDSPALDVAVRLKGLGAEVVATDPQGIENARARHPQLLYTPETTEALRHADAVVLVTEWRAYRDLDPVAVAEIARGSVVVDGRNVLDRAAWRDAGWTYVGMGRP